MMLPKRVKLALRLASEVVPKLPAKGDTVLQIGLKLLAMADTVQQVLNPGRQNALENLVETYDLVETTNEQFVSLFFETNLHKEFVMHRYALEDYLDVIEARSEKYGRLFFTEYAGATRQPEETFFHSKDFNFTEVLQGIWDAYEGRLHVTISYGKYTNKTASQFATFHAPPNPLYGTMGQQMERLVTRHRRWLLDGIPRSYMFYGAPGTGKTSFALAFADRIGHRVLKLDAGSLVFASVRDISFLLDALAPDFLLIDDVDKADVQSAIPTLLDILSRFKTEHTKTSVIMTANTTKQFDAGLLRPNRIDTWIEFPKPEEEERRAILLQYIKAFSIQVSDSIVEALVKATASLTQDYVREAAHMLKYEDPGDAIRTVELMRKLLEENENASKESAPKADTPGVQKAS